MAPIREDSGDIGLGRLIQAHGMQAGIMAIGCQELDMGAALHQAALVHDQNLVSLLDGRQAVSDHQCGTALHDVVKGSLDVALGLGIQGRSRLVENQQRRVLQQCPGDRQALALATGKQYAVLADFGIEPLGSLSTNSLA